jgi:hypothetical protein
VSLNLADNRVFDRRNIQACATRCRRNAFAALIQYPLNSPLFFFFGDSVFSCDTEIVPKNITITLSEEVAHWAREKAAEQNTSVSKLVGRVLEEQMRVSDDYWRAYERWKKIGSIKGIGAAGRLTRDKAHGRS